jgi:hypothetical protein
MPLSQAERSRRWREKHVRPVLARKPPAEIDRHDRGIPAGAVDELPELPAGAWETRTGHLRPRVGHYAAADGTFPEIPRELLAEPMTTATGEVVRIPEAHARQLAEAGAKPLSPEERNRRMAMTPAERRADAARPPADLSALFVH